MPSRRAIVRKDLADRAKIEYDYAKAIKQAQDDVVKALESFSIATLIHEPLRRLSQIRNGLPRISRQEHNAAIDLLSQGAHKVSKLASGCIVRARRAAGTS